MVGGQNSFASCVRLSLSRLGKWKLTKGLRRDSGSLHELIRMSDEVWSGEREVTTIPLSKICLYVQFYRTLYGDSDNLNKLKTYE